VSRIRLDVRNVTVQGGTNGWAPLANTSALHPSTGSAAIRKQNKNTSIILWTIGDMTANQEASLLVDIQGSIPRKTKDCEIRYLTGAWSALYSLDGSTILKSDYTGRVSIQVDSNGNPNDCQ